MLQRNLISSKTLQSFHCTPVWPFGLFQWTPRRKRLRVYSCVWLRLAKPDLSHSLFNMYISQDLEDIDQITSPWIIWASVSHLSVQFLILELVPLEARHYHIQASTQQQAQHLLFCKIGIWSIAAKLNWFKNIYTMAFHREHVILSGTPETIIAYPLSGTLLSSGNSAVTKTEEASAVRVLHPIRRERRCTQNCKHYVGNHKSINAMKALNATTWKKVTVYWYFFPFIFLFHSICLKGTIF